MLKVRVSLPRWIVSATLVPSLPWISDVVGLDQARRLLERGDVNALDRAVADIRNPLWVRLVDPRARDKADREHQREGATPQGDAAVHLSRLANARLAAEPDARVFVAA